MNEPLTKRTAFVDNLLVLLESLRLPAQSFAVGDQVEGALRREAQKLAIRVAGMLRKAGFSAKGIQRFRRRLFGQQGRAQRSLLLVCVGGEEKSRIGRIRLHPVRIGDLGVRLANEQEWQFLTRTMQAKGKVFGTTMEVERQVGMIALG